MTQPCEKAGSAKKWIRWNSADRKKMCLCGALEDMKEKNIPEDLREDREQWRLRLGKMQTYI